MDVFRVARMLCRTLGLRVSVPPSRLIHTAGVGAVEFALILPVVLLILSGLVEHGFALLNAQKTTNASRWAARLGSAQSADNPLGLPFEGLSADISCITPEMIDCKIPVNPMQYECWVAGQTKAHLPEMGLDTEDWKVEAKTCLLSEGSLNDIHAIRVRVSRAPTSRGCVLCWHHWIGLDFETTNSVFPLYR